MQWANVQQLQRFPSSTLNHFHFRASPNKSTVNGLPTFAGRIRTLAWQWLCHAAYVQCCPHTKHVAGCSASRPFYWSSKYTNMSFFTTPTDMRGWGNVWKLCSRQTWLAPLGVSIYGVRLARSLSAHMQKCKHYSRRRPTAQDAACPPRPAVPRSCWEGACTISAITLTAKQLLPC